VCVETIPRLIYVGLREWDFVVVSSGTDESMHFPVKSSKTLSEEKDHCVSEDFVVASSGTDESMHFPVKSSKTLSEEKDHCVSEYTL